MKQAAFHNHPSPCSFSFLSLFFEGVRRGMVRLCEIPSVVLRRGWECFISLLVMLILGGAGPATSGSTLAEAAGCRCCLVPEGWDSSIPAFPLASISFGWFLFLFWTSSLRFNILSPPAGRIVWSVAVGGMKVQENFDHKLPCLASES